MALVPSHIAIGNVAFRLAAHEHGVRLVEKSRGLQPLGLVIERLLVDRRGAARVREFVDRQDFAEAHLFASVVQPADPVLDNTDGALNWMRLAGSLPDLSDAYRIGTTFLDEMLVIPRATLIELIERMSELNDAVLAGRLEPGIDTTQPVPAPPLTPEVAEQIAEYDRLLGIAQEFADDFAQQLMQGKKPRIPKPDLTDRSHELLAEFEEKAGGLETIDQNARRLPEPYADQRLDAYIAGRRRMLLFELDVAGVLAASGAREMRARLVSLGLPNLVTYHDAAMAMHRYLGSPARERLVGTPPPTNILECAVSLDWFRVPSGYVAEGCSPEEWLALCELNFARNVPAQQRAGRRFLRLEGRTHQLLHRMEAEPQQRLWRAWPEPAGEARELPPTPEVVKRRSEPRPEFPLERELDDGSYQITEHLWGTPDRGCYRGIRLLDGEPVVVALGSPQQRGRTELVAALTLAGPGIVPLRGIAELIEENESPLSALIEDAPPGMPLASIALPFSLADAVGLGIALARVIKQVHAHGQIVRGIRPELVYVDGKRSLSGLVPRCELFWSLAPAPGYGVAPCFEELYLAPEILAGRDAVPASDVFSLCALLAHVASGEHPFAAPSMMGQITAIAAGKRGRWNGPEVLAGILDAGLAADPAKRPSPARVIEALEKTRPS